VVSSSIQDGGSAGASGASLVEVGGGTMTLSGNSTYTGGATVVGGKLIVTSVHGAGFGTIGFTSGSQTLAISARGFDSSNHFANVLANSDQADTLDLQGLAFLAEATAFFDDTTLTVTSGGLSEEFALSGSYDGRRFVVFNGGATRSALH
jgi:autotransporter-associated beta strand protein